MRNNGICKRFSGRGRRTVALFADFCDDLVHGPAAVQLGVGQDLEWHVVLLCVPLDRLWGASIRERLGLATSRRNEDKSLRLKTHVEGSVAVSADALVDREEAQVETVVVALVQEFHDIREHGRVCAQRTTISGGAEVAVTAEG